MNDYTIVSGSHTWLSNNPYQWNVPVVRSLRVVDLNSLLPDYIDQSYCEIVRKGTEIVTCHVCEGGHHEHVWWPR